MMHTLILAFTTVSCADLDSFVRESTTLTTFYFSLMRGRRIKIPLLAGHHWPASEPYSFVIFQGGSPDPCPPTGSVHVFEVSSMQRVTLFSNHPIYYG